MQGRLGRLISCTITWASAWPAATRRSRISTEADLLINVNLRGMVYATKHALPIMREQQSGSIVNISSMAWSNYPWVGYKTTKSAVIALTEQTAARNAAHNIRANVILPGLMDTPMAVDTGAGWNKPRERYGRA